MSLITRCSACGTMFKVVADQLKISQGWVRCGHCAEVFDAAANLQPYTSPSATGSPSEPADAAPEVQPQAGHAASVAPMLLAPSSEMEAAAPEPLLENQDVHLAVPPSLPEVQVSPSPDIAADVFAFSVSPEPSGFSVEEVPEVPKVAVVGTLDELEMPGQDKAHEVSFVRDARRDAFWRRPALRWALGLAASVLLAALLLQVALFQRNVLAATQPWLSTGLQTLCFYLQCEIRPPQHIESVVIDSSSFNKLAPDAYRLKVVIRNAGPMVLALPSLELTLTDTQDQAQLRRVLTPAELGATGATLAAGADFSGAVAIQVSNPPPDASAPLASSARPPGPLRIAGYRVLAFYP